MAAFYYLISSLPMLTFGETPRVSSEEFLSACTDFVSAIELKELKELSLIPPEDYSWSANQTAIFWYQWETCLRNVLVHLRLKSKGGEWEKYLRAELDFFSEIEKGVQEAFNKSNPLEMENALDRLRWGRLDDMESGHMFDFCKLCIYKLRLLLCEKQGLLNTEKGSRNFDQIVKYIYEQNPVSPRQIKA